ncbi:uncharacterized protein ATNIH1004_011763 [Aspergillus tanneri]|uniref:Uncharacterized protein n=1 Tax=Aspergillus tanneri TaxID=1220188 RepID=A0A5M9MF78_9EURO|nr:uncharacterized protein ATNIH1004_011763 [Aspergillus tanneri]KAA8641627.1 hypothetical protein ATNIH1004_011763 [Aspergillus tanneri]
MDSEIAHDGTLVSKLAGLTDISASPIADYLGRRFSGQSEQQKIEFFRRTAELEQLLDRVAFMDCMEVPGLTLKLLFALATPVLPPTASADCENAAQIRLLLQSTPRSANGADPDAGEQRTAAEPARRDGEIPTASLHSGRGITGADGLFKFLLIDVQISMCLQTSHIKQGISTVHPRAGEGGAGLEQHGQRRPLEVDGGLQAGGREPQGLPLSGKLAGRNPARRQGRSVQGARVRHPAERPRQCQEGRELEQHVPFPRTRTAPYIYYYRTLGIVPGPTDRGIKIYWQPWTKIDGEVLFDLLGGPGPTFAVVLLPSNVPAPSPSILVIDVERRTDAGAGDGQQENQQENRQPRYLNYPLGRLSLRDARIAEALAIHHPDHLREDVASHGKGQRQTVYPSAEGRAAGSRCWAIIVTKLVDNIPRKDVQWTLSFNDSLVKNATGFIQDIVTTESTISYVTYPPIASTSTFVSDVFQRTFDRDLVSMSTTYDRLDQAYAFLANVPADDTYLAFGKRNGPVHELSTPYAIYNWELGAHAVMLLMKRLQVNRQKDLALQVAHFVFDPTHIEILVASSDVYFRQNTLEALPFAIQCYVEASHVFSSALVRVPRFAEPTYKSYADLDKVFDDFSNAAFDMELDFPFFSDPASRSGGAKANGPLSLTGTLKTTYFCVPTNPKLIELRNLIDDRLFKICNDQDINSVF